MRIHRTIAAILLVSLAGCATTRVMQAPATELATTKADRIWVMHANGAEVIIDSPRLQNDTIFGLDTRGRNYALPLRHAETITVREISKRKTIMFGVGLAAAAVGLLVLVKGGTGLAKIGNADCDKRPYQTECMP